MESFPTLLGRREGATRWVRLNRPEARNGTDVVMRQELMPTRSAPSPHRRTDGPTGSDPMTPPFIRSRPDPDDRSPHVRLRTRHHHR